MANNRNPPSKKSSSSTAPKLPPSTHSSLGKAVIDETRNIDRKINKSSNLKRRFRKLIGIPPEEDRCILTRLLGPNPLFCHVLPRALSSQYIAILERVWGLQSGTLNVDSTRNLFLCHDQHRRNYDEGGWMFIPTLPILQRIWEVVQSHLVKGRDTDGYEWTLYTKDFPHWVYPYNILPLTMRKNGGVITRREQKSGDPSRDPPPEIKVNLRGERTRHQVASLEALEEFLLQRSQDEHFITPSQSAPSSVRSGWSSSKSLDFDAPYERPNSPHKYQTYSHSMAGFPVIYGHFHPYYAIFDAGLKLLKYRDVIPKMSFPKEQHQQIDGVLAIVAAWGFTSETVPVASAGGSPASSGGSEVDLCSDAGSTDDHSAHKFESEQNQTDHSGGTGYKGWKEGVGDNNDEMKISDHTPELCLPGRNPRSSRKTPNEVSPILDSGHPFALGQSPVYHTVQEWVEHSLTKGHIDTIHNDDQVTEYSREDVRKPPSEPWHLWRPNNDLAYSRSKSRLDTSNFSSNDWAITQYNTLLTGSHPAGEDTRGSNHHSSKMIPKA